MDYGIRLSLTIRFILTPVIDKSCQYFLKYQNTMLQKLSKYEVKAWLCWSLIFLPALRFYEKSNLGEFKRFKNVIFGNFRGFEFWCKKIWATFKAQIYQNSNFRVSKITENNIFGPFGFAKIGFYDRCKWR